MDKGKRQPAKITIRAASPAEHLRNTQAIMFSDWIEECVAMQEAFIEGLLAMLPSAEDKR